MFLNIFKKKTLEDKLKDEYEKLMLERKKLINQNNDESHLKYHEAQRVLNKIESLKNAF